MRLSETSLRARLALAACGGVVLAALPAAADAATITNRADCVAEGRICGSYIDFAAAPGETNDVVYTAAGATGGYRFRDTGAPITGEAEGCQRVDANELVCTAASGPSGGGSAIVTIELGDGNDRIVSSPDATIDAGMGADRIEGGLLSYFVRTAPITVDLAAGSGGEAGENDVLVNVRGVAGGSGDDVLRGSAARDMLDGGGGTDMVEGLGGNDTLVGGIGADTLDGGAGNDIVEPEEPTGDDARADTVTCGAGRDRVGNEDSISAYRYSDPADRIATDCERLTLPSIEVVPRARVSNGKLVIRVRGGDCDCRGQVAVRTGSGRTLASGRSDGGKNRIVVPLNRAGRRLFARPGPHRVEIAWRADGERAGFSTLVAGAT